MTTHPNPNPNPNPNPSPIPNPKLVLDLKNKETLNNFTYVHARRKAIQKFGLVNLRTSEPSPLGSALRFKLKVRDSVRTEIQRIEIRRVEIRRIGLEPLYHKSI